MLNAYWKWLYLISTSYVYQRVPKRCCDAPSSNRPRLRTLWGKGSLGGWLFGQKFCLRTKSLRKFFRGVNCEFPRKFLIYIYIYISYLSILSSHTLHVFFERTPRNSRFSLPGTGAWTVSLHVFILTMLGMRPCYKAFWRRRTAEVAVKLKLHREITVGKHWGNVQNIPWKGEPKTPWTSSRKMLTCTFFFRVGKKHNCNKNRSVFSRRPEQLEVHKLM